MPRARQGGLPGAPRDKLTDLVPQAEAMNGKIVGDVARETLEAASELIKDWRELRPILTSLIAKVRIQADTQAFEGFEAARLLSLAANVTQKIAAASQGVLRASEGQHRLALILTGGITRPKPEHLTEKQMAKVVIAAVKRIAEEQGSCPICATTITVTNGKAPDAE